MRKNIKSETVWAVIGESGSIQYVFTERDEAQALVERWSSREPKLHCSIESVELVKGKHFAAGDSDD